MREIFTRTNGIFLQRVCDSILLIADREGRKTCPYVTEISESSAVLWEYLSEPATEEACVQRLYDEYHVDDVAELKESVHAFLAEMVANHYLSVRCAEGS